MTNSAGLRMEAGACPACGFASPAGMRFCGRCGSRLDGEAPRAEADAPPGPSRGSEPERRQLTVMFCDLVGSSALAQQLDLEEFRDLIRAFQDGCVSIVREFGGTVTRFMGDALLVLFGYPKAGEDAAERAVLAGLRMAAAVRQIDLPQRPGERLAVRVGIATGLAVVGDWIGEGASLEQAVLGETPNLAARLQTLAPPDSVVISGASRALIGSEFVCENLGMQSVKGFAEPVAAWRVSAAGSAHNRFRALRAAMLTPLVDREDELAWLDGLWEAARQQRGRIALIGGEPGIGKSRLVEALRQRIGTGEPVCLNLQCSPYYTNRALHPVIRYIEGTAFLDKEDAPPTKVHRLAQWLGEASVHASAIALLGGLLSIPSAELPALPPMTASRQKELTFGLLTELLQGIAATRPVLLVCEDLQWIDPTSEELLTHLVARVQRMRVLVVCTHRSEYVPAWEGVEQRTLQRLSGTQAQVLVSHVAGAGALPAGVVQELVAASDGIPLFVEEVTRAALHHAAGTGAATGLTGSRGQLAIPSTLHDTLLARLDQLGPERHVAQLASVIGREFTYPLLQAISSLPPERLHADMLALERSGLIFAEQGGASARYAFNHALIREAAYETLLRSRRRELHALTAEVLEHRFPQTASEAPELVAHHWSEAGQPERAVASWVLAGQRAGERSEYREAIGHLQRALQLVPQLAGEADRRRRELELLLELAPALIVTQGAAPPKSTGSTRARWRSASSCRPPRCTSPRAGAGGVSRWITARGGDGPASSSALPSSWTTRGSSCRRTTRNGRRSTCSANTISAAGTPTRACASTTPAGTASTVASSEATMPRCARSASRRSRPGCWPAWTRRRRGWTPRLPGPTSSGMPAAASMPWTTRCSWTASAATPGRSRDAPTS